MFRLKMLVLPTLVILVAVLLAGSIPAGATSLAGVTRPGGLLSGLLTPDMRMLHQTTHLHNLPVQVAPAKGCSSWNVIPSPNPPSSFNQLLAISASSPSNAWAVGASTSFNTGNTATLIEHWNGHKWLIVPSPSPAPTNYLMGVMAFSKTAIAIGYTVTNNIYQTLIEQWDGTKWSAVPSPNPSSNDFFIGGAASSPSDAWAVGSGNGIGTLTAHWNGTSWKVVSSPNPGGSNSFLQGVTSSSPTNAWAVGDYIDGKGRTLTLIEQWNGTHWNVVPSPDPSPNNINILHAVAGNTTSAFAAGTTINGNNSSTLIQQWNGKKWSIDPSPNPSNSTFLEGVAFTSSTNAVVVGYSINLGLIEQWDGTRWNVVTSGLPGTPSTLNAVTLFPKTNHYWAVGYYSPPNGYPSTVIERC